MNIKDIKKMGYGEKQYNSWRLRTLSEEKQLEASARVEESIRVLKDTLAYVKEGNKEKAIANLKSVVEYAQKAITDVEG